MAQWVTDNRKIGIGLTGFGVTFLFLGIMLFFDRALLALGNLLFICGIILLIGTKRTLKFFLAPDKLRGTICFIIGILIVLFSYPIIGMTVEVFGIINLFGNFFPVILTFLRQIPGLKIVLNSAYVRPVLNKICGDSYLIGED